MNAVIVIPLVGYVGLWLTGSLLFVIYFRLLHIPIDLKHTLEMIQKVPSPLAIVTVPLCSFASFFITTRVVVGGSTSVFDNGVLLQIGAVALVLTIVLDILITVVGEKIDIRKFPVNWMYLLAWLVIIPSIFLASQYQ